jgi:hypothetical protein
MLAVIRNDMPAGVRAMRPGRFDCVRLFALAIIGRGAEDGIGHISSNW